MKKFQTWLLKFSGVFAALALILAQSTANVTCWFASYQPEEPEM